MRTLLDTSLNQGKVDSKEKELYSEIENLRVKLSNANNKINELLIENSSLKILNAKFLKIIKNDFSYINLKRIINERQISDDSTLLIDDKKIQFQEKDFKYLKETEQNDQNSFFEVSK